MQQLPPELRDEYDTVRPIGPDGDRGRGTFLVYDRKGHTFFLKTSHPYSVVEIEETYRILRRRGVAGRNHVQLPITTVMSGRTFYEIFEYRPLGSIADYVQTNSLDPTHVHVLVRQLFSALRFIHGESSQSEPIVHGDIKPSNILVRELGDGSLRFQLSDFHSALRCDPQRAQLLASFTPRYAAPEVLRESTSSLTPALDFWAFGMTLLELLLNRHPFHGLSGDQIPELIVSDEWDLQAGYVARVSDYRLKALVGGLVQRQTMHRWGRDELARWCDGSSEIVAVGLRLLGESASDVPIEIAGETAHTVSTLASAVLRSWATDALSSPAVTEWLGSFRPDVVDRIAGLDREAGLTPDTRLLEFCYAYYPRDDAGESQMPAIWRGYELSPATLSRLATAPDQDIPAAHDWIDGLFDANAFDFFRSRPEFASVKRLYESIQRTRTELDEAWRQIISAGAPADARPSASLENRVVISLACSNEYMANLEAAALRLFDPRMVFRRSDWFFVFGSDPDELSLAQAHVLVTLQRTSLYNETNVDSLSDMMELDPEHLRSSIIVPDSQSRLMRTLSIYPGARIHDLSMGERHSADESFSFSTTIGRFFDRESPEPSEALDTGEAEQESENPLGISIKIIRLSPLGFKASEILAYLAMIEWHAPDEFRPNLELRSPGQLLKVPKLRMRRLPPEGRLLLVLTQDSLIRLTHKASLFELAQKTEDIEIRFGQRDTFRRVASSIRTVVKRIIDLQENIRSPQERIRSFDSVSLIPVEQEVLQWDPVQLREAGEFTPFMHALDSLKSNRTELVSRTEQRINKESEDG